jgi:hypothetical protein
MGQQGSDWLFPDAFRAACPRDFQFGALTISMILK